MINKRIYKTVTYLTASFVFAVVVKVLIANTNVYAACADGWHCVGTTVLDRANGCNTSIGICNETHDPQEIVTCNNECGYNYLAPQCDSEVVPCAAKRYWTCPYYENRCWPTGCGTRENCPHCGEYSYSCRPHDVCLWPVRNYCNHLCIACVTEWDTCTGCNTCYYCTGESCEYVVQTFADGVSGSCTTGNVDDCSDGCCRTTSQKLCWECVPGTNCYQVNNVPLSTNCCERNGPVIPPPVCNSNPGAPTLIAPSNGSTIVDNNTIAFRWSGNGWGGDACVSRVFRLQVDNNNNFLTPEIVVGGIGENVTSITRDLVGPEGTYFWRVRAANNRGSTWSGAWSFDLDYVPPTAEFTNPTTNITINPNQATNFSAQASDPGGAMTRMQIERYNTAGGPPAQPDQVPAIILGADEACAGANCVLTRSWTPTDADIGTWEVYVNAYDENEVLADGKCTGLSSGSAGWGNCDTGVNPDSITVTVEACQEAPDAATGPSPSDGENNVGMPVTAGWDALSGADWGFTCGVQSNSYRVYARERGGGCLAADDPSLPVGDPSRNYSEVCDLGTPPNPPNNSCNAGGFFDTRNLEFCWYVETDNGELIAQSNVWWFETEDPLVYQQWMTTLYGDFYAGSVSMEFPNQIDYIAPWTPPHLSYEDNPASPDTTDVSTLSSNDIDISTDNSDSGYYPESHSGFLAKYTNFTQTWPANYRGDPPAGATEISSDCDEIFTSGNLNPDTTYKADASCVNTGISNVSGGNYQLSDDGVITLYVTGSSDLRFDNEFVSTNADRRVVFITGEDVDVKIDSSLNSGNPTFASTPEIEAAFVINKSMEFERKAGDPDPETNPDTSVVIEGPIITKSVLFERNRGLTNSYPSEVIKYNSYYLYKLTSQERGSNDSNYSGLFVIDVDWISEE